MKKSIIVIICVLTVSLFIMQYGLTNHQNFNDIVYGEKQIGNYYEVQLPHDILENKTNDIIENIETVCDTYNASFFITKSNNSDYIKYTHLNHEDEYKEILKIKTLDYASTNNKENKIEQFDSTFQLTIKDLSEIEISDYKLEGEAIFVTENHSDFNRIIQHLNALLSIEIRETTADSGEVDMMVWLMTSVFAFYLILALLVIYDLLSQFKTFSIYKLNGYSSFTIWKDYMIRILSNQFIFSFIGYSVLTMVKCQRFNIYIKDFLISGFKMLSILLIITFAICSVIIYHFTDVKAIDFIKNKNISKKFMIFNQFILFIIIIITVALTSVGIDKGYAILSRYNNRHEWEKTKDYYIISSIGNVENASLFDDKEFIAKQKNLFIEFNALDSIYADFNEFDEEAFDDTSMAYVNVNYLLNHTIQDVNGNDIVISENETQRVVLVNESTSFSKDELIELTEGMYDISQGVKIIYYKDNQKFFTYNSYITDGYTNMISKPIVQVLTNSNGNGSDYDRILAYKYNPYKIKANQKTIKNILEKYDLSRYINNYITAYDEMSELNHNESVVFIIVLLTFIALVLLITIILMQNITIYVNRNIKLLSIQTMNGYSYIDKYKSLIQMSIITLGLTFIICYIIGYPIDYLLVIYFAIICLWYGIFKVKINSQEKKSIISMLKGGQ